MKKPSKKNDPNEFIEHRRFRRFRFDEGGFQVSVDDSFEARGQLLDLSQSGLSFKYQSNDGDNEAFVIHIIGPDGEARVSDLPYLNVSDFEVASGYPFPHPPWRRRGVRFNKPTLAQLRRIAELIRSESDNE